jgi:hypothetical protein
VYVVCLKKFHFVFDSPQTQFFALEVKKNALRLFKGFDYRFLQSKSDSPRFTFLCFLNQGFAMSPEISRVITKARIFLKKS